MMFVVRFLHLALVLAFACGGSQTAGSAKVLVNVDDQGVALGGHDAIAYSQGSAAQGTDQHTSTYDTAIYKFASADNKRTFDRDPAGRAPRYGGYCAYAASQNRLTAGDPMVWRIIDGQLLMFANTNFRDMFEKDPAANRQKADANWPGLVAQHGQPR